MVGVNKVLTNFHPFLAFLAAFDAVRLRVPHFLYQTLTIYRASAYFGLSCASAAE